MWPSAIEVLIGKKVSAIVVYLLNVYSCIYFLNCQLFIEKHAGDKVLIAVVFIKCND